MKKLLKYLAASCFMLAALASHASEQAGNLAPEPTVGIVWVGVFVAMFVGLCVWFFVAMIRHDRKTKTARDNAS